MSEDGAYGEDGLWYSAEQWETWIQDECYWQRDAQGRSPLWRAAASGNATSVRMLLREGVEVDEVDMDGVTPMLAAVRQKRWEVVAVLLRAGAFREPWTWTVRKGKKWKRDVVTKYEFLVKAVKKGRRSFGKNLDTHPKKRKLKPKAVKSQPLAGQPAKTKKSKQKHKQQAQKLK